MASFRFHFLALLFTILEVVKTQDECCPQETWASCPCLDKSEPRSLCCDFGYLCTAGKNCVEVDIVEKDLERIRGEISDAKCTYYSIIEQVFGCGATSYAEKYGLQYCQDYLEKKEEFRKGQWHDNTRKCIQETISVKIERNFHDKGPITCEALNGFGYSSHVPCYFTNDTQKSYCSLTNEEKIKTTLIAISDTNKALPTDCTVFETCGNHNITTLCQPLNFEYDAYDWIEDKTSYFKEAVESSFGTHLAARYYLGSNEITLKRENITYRNPRLRELLERGETKNISSRYLEVQGVEVISDKIRIGSYSLNNMNVILANRLTEPFNKFGNSSEAIVGLGPNSAYVAKLKSDRIIKKAVFYHSNSQILFGEEPQMISSIAAAFPLTSNDNWRIKADFFSFESVNRDSGVKTERRLLNVNDLESLTDLSFEIEVQDNLDSFIYFTSKSSNYFKSFQDNFFGSQFSSCFSLSTGMMTYVVQCAKNINLELLPNLKFHLSSYSYVIYPKKLFVNKGRYYEFLVMFQIFDYEKSILSTGISFLESIGIKVVFSQEEKTLVFYGGHRIDNNY